LNTPDVRQRLAQLGAEPHPMSPEDYARFIGADLKKWTDVLQEAESNQKTSGKN
jgi:tripartite-type tricarboxylate transporter receptor subunit TctC